MAVDVPGAPARSLKMRIQKNPDATVVICSGRLTSDISAAFKEEVKSLLPRAPRIVLDLSDLSHMDSAGLGALVGVYVSAKTAKCELQLINLNQRVRELLRISNMLSMFGSCGQYLTKMP